MNRMMGCVLAAMCLVPVSAGSAGIAASSQQAAAPVALKPYVVDYYYKVKWGHFEEFLELYKRNHYPILKRMQQDGQIISMSMAYPHNHASEASRWDMRFTIVYRDVVAEQTYDASAVVKELYPDKDKFLREEQRCFELLLEHLDIPMNVEDLSTWR